MDQKERERQSNMPEPQHTTVEHTSPIWRVAAVALTAGFVAALGFYLERVGLGQQFSTVFVITLVYSISFWARRRPDQLEVRFGPFSKIASAIVESQDDLREWTLRRTWRAGVLVAASIGVGIAVAQTFVLSALRSLYSWELAVAAGCIVAAVAAAPHLFRNFGSKLSGPAGEDQDDSEDPTEDDPDDRDENASDDSGDQGRDDD